MTIAPRGSSEPAIHFLRAVTGLAGVRNQVQAAPSAIAFSGCVTRPEAITMWMPAVVAILPASILVSMPPRDSSEPDAPAIASISGVMRGTSGTSLPPPVCRRLVVEAVDVGQQHQQVGAGHGGDARGKAVIVAVADFGWLRRCRSR